MYNVFKSAILMILMSALMIFVGSMIGGKNGATLFFLISLGINFFSYYFSGPLVIKAYRAQKADYYQHRRLFEILEELSRRAELPKVPELYILPMSVPNAFATGRNPQNAIVAVTEGLIQNLSEDEIAAVIAHELGHIKNRDILVSTIAASMASAIMWISNIARFGAIFGGRDDEDNGGGIIGVILITMFASLAATLIQLAISRSREYMADDFSAKIMGSGRPLANALLRLHNQAPRYEGVSEITPATAHMFIFPAGTGRALINLFSTHPSLEDRLANLEKNI